MFLLATLYKEIIKVCDTILSNSKEIKVTQSSDQQPSSNLLPLLLIGCLLVQMFFTVLVWRDVRALREESALALQALSIPDVANHSSCPGIEMGSNAPPLVLQDTDNNEVALTDYRGRYVLFVFSATDCSYCVELYDDLKRYDEEFRADDTAMLLVSRSTAEENRALKQDKGFHFPVLMATQDAFRSFAVQGTPSLVLVDKEGKISACDTAQHVEEIVQFVQSHQ